MPTLLVNEFRNVFILLAGTMYSPPGESPTTASMAWSAYPPSENEYVLLYAALLIKLLAYPDQYEAIVELELAPLDDVPENDPTLIPDPHPLLMSWMAATIAAAPLVTALDIVDDAVETAPDIVLVLVRMSDLSLAPFVFNEVIIRLVFCDKPKYIFCKIPDDDSCVPTPAVFVASVFKVAVIVASSIVALKDSNSDMAATVSNARVAVTGF